MMHAQHRRPCSTACLSQRAPAAYRTPHPAGRRRRRPRRRRMRRECTAARAWSACGALGPARRPPHRCRPGTPRAPGPRRPRAAPLRPQRMRPARWGAPAPRRARPCPGLRGPQQPRPGAAAALQRLRAGAGTSARRARRRCLCGAWIAVLLRPLLPAPRQPVRPWLPERRDNANLTVCAATVQMRMHIQPAGWKSL